MLADQPRQSKTGNRRIPLLVRLLGPLTTRACWPRPTFNEPGYILPNFTSRRGSDVDVPIRHASPDLRTHIHEVAHNHYSRLPYKDWAVNHHCL
jgi:hypothetical protein